MEEYLPGLQSKQVVEALLAAYFPAMHLRQLSADEAPATVENVPAEHPTHRIEVDAPSVVKNVPVTQRLQSDAALLPSVSEYLPAAQSMHSPVPEPVLYFPASHGLHSGPKYPALQKHDSDPGTESILCLQARQPQVAAETFVAFL